MPDVSFVIKHYSMHWHKKAEPDYGREFHGREFPESFRLVCNLSACQQALPLYAKSLKKKK